MKRAGDYIREDAYAKGKSEGIVCTARELGASDDIIVSCLMKNMNISQKDAKRCYDELRAAGV